MKVPRTLALVLVIIVSLLLGWIYLAGTVVEKTVFSPVYYRGLVVETDFAANLHEELQSALPEMMLEGMQEEMIGVRNKPPCHILPKGGYNTLFLYLTTKSL